MKIFRRTRENVVLFEGTHRFHNFASGLRLSHSAEAERRFTCEATGFSWPLALSSRQSSAACRSVLTCRVLREVRLHREPSESKYKCST